jgi:hypothetical protein
LTFIHDPQLFALISLYEHRITRNIQANLKMLFQLQSLPKPENRMREEVAASTAMTEIPETARAATGQFVLQNAKSRLT